MFEGGILELFIMAALFLAVTAIITLIVSCSVDLCRYFAPKDREATVFARNQIDVNDYLFKREPKI